MRKKNPETLKEMKGLGHQKVLLQLPLERVRKLKEATVQDGRWPLPGSEARSSLPQKAATLSPLPLNTRK